jgi:hypothetical protein
MYCPTVPLFCAPYAIQKSIGSIGRAPNCRILSVSIKIYEGTEGDRGKVMDARAARARWWRLRGSLNQDVSA